MIGDLISKTLLSKQRRISKKKNKNKCSLSHTIHIAERLVFQTWSKSVMYAFSRESVK